MSWAAALTEERAVVSPCSAYRYWLRREVGEGGAPICFVMLNPSTADAETDDPTIRRCMGYAKEWGGSELIVVNLFAYRATSPADMKKAPAPIGPDNSDAILAALERCRDGIVVAGWGAHGKFKNRGANVRRQIKMAGYKLHYLKLTNAGQPCHPLYLKADLQPVEWI